MFGNHIAQFEVAGGEALDVLHARQAHIVTTAAMEGKCHLHVGTTRIADYAVESIVDDHKFGKSLLRRDHPCRTLTRTAWT